MREPNTQLCSYFGRKLSNIMLPEVEVTKPFYIVFGSERDDEIYFGDCLEDGEEMLMERVLMTVMDDEGTYIDIDLEDILKFAAIHCRALYWKVYDNTD